MLRTFIKPLVFVLLFSLGLVGLGLVSAEQPPIKTYSANQGLVHDRIFRIMRDSHGFLWFGTNDGLSRFDGQNFVNYTTADGLIHTRIEDIVESRDGTYWIGTLGGLSSFVPSRDSLPFLRSNSSQPLFTNHVIHGDKNANVIASLLEDRAGQLWIGTQAGLFRLNRTATDPTKRFEAISVGFPNKPDNLFEVVLMAEDHEGSLWLGSIFGLSRRLPDGRFVHYSVKPGEGTDSIRAIVEDREGRLWIGQQSGLMIYKPEPAAAAKSGFIALEKIAQQNSSPNLQDGKLILPAIPGEARWYTTADGLEDQRARAICETADGHVWIGTLTGGLSEFDGQRFRNLTTGQGISRLITALAEDRAGNLWVGARVGGVTKIARSGFMTYRLADGLGSTDVFSIFADRDKRVIVFNNDWTINQFDGKRFTSVKPNLPEKVKGSSTGNRPTIQAHDGEWWVATGEGLFRFPAVESIEELATVKPKAAYFESDGLASNNITRMMEDSRGDLWISSYTPPVTLTRWERATGKFYRYAESDGIPSNNWAHVMAEDRAGNIWMGLHYGELMRVRNGKIEVFHHSDGVPQGMMLGLYCDSVGRM
ncbi:MAG: hypothetical protein JNK38_16105, partial [Acidobacteria bacterium]|nr:hypothetical protein [Acidobacteriota bacterium]